MSEKQLSRKIETLGRRFDRSQNEQRKLVSDVEFLKSLIRSLEAAYDAKDIDSAD